MSIMSLANTHNFYLYKNTGPQQINYKNNIHIIYENKGCHPLKVFLQIY